MPTEFLSIGPPIPLVQNTVYALPAVQCVLFTDATTPTLQASNTLAFTANVALTLTAGSTAVAGGFLKATTTGVTVKLSRQ